MQTPEKRPWLRVAAQSVVGRERAHNQEGAAVFPLGGGAPRALGAGVLGGASLQGAWPADAGVGLLVAHGIGGQSTGDWACEAVLESLTKRLSEELPGEAEARGGWLADALHAASARVDAYAKKRMGPHGSLGATVVLAVACGQVVHVLHVGDTRAYLLREGRLAQLTVDDSLLNDYRKHLDRELTEEELRQIPPNIVTQALGFERTMQPHVQVLEAAAGDVLMICTTGLYQFVDAARMAEEIGRAGHLAEACAKLEELAVSGGSDSHISVLLARFEEDQPSGT